MTAEPLIAQLARHLQRPVPEAVRTRARLHLLDWLACVAGAHAERAQIFPPWRGPRVSAHYFLGNILEMDDIHRASVLHPGPVIWPIALDEGYQPEAMDRVLDAAIRGYEAMVTFGETLDAYHYSLWHPTATAGALGAAATVGSTWDIGEERLCWALSHAASVAGGLWHMRHRNVKTKQWHIVHAAKTGQDAVHCAVAGLSGSADILEGPQGLYAAMTPKPMVFTDHWRIEEVSFKPWAACRHAHPAIDCALELRAGGKLIAPFVLETYADALTFCDKPNPKTEAEAKFSLQHAIAVIADGRNATPADFTLEAIAALAPLRAQVKVSKAPDITARYPAHFGARLNGFELVDCRGDPERPVTEADIVAKMHMAEWGGLPSSEADRAAELALHGDDARAILAMLDGWLS
jgi:2-methylcitrate dehydratase PrpD